MLSSYEPLDADKDPERDEPVDDTEGPKQDEPVETPADDDYVIDEQEKQDVRSKLTQLIWTEADIDASLECNTNNAADAVLSPWLGSMQMVSGMMLVNQLGIFFLVRFFATCSDSGQAAYPFWIWLAALPVVIIRFLVEVRTIKALVPAYILVVLPHGNPPFKLGPIALTSLLWFCTFMGFSASNVADMGTDSCFTGTTLAALHCPSYRAGKVWETTLKQSLLTKCGLPAVDLGLLAISFWVLSLFQMVVPLLQTAGLMVTESSIVVSCAGKLGYVEDVAAELAEGSGMATIQSLLAPKCLANIIRTTQNQEFSEERRNFVLDLYACPLARVMALRVWLSYVLESALQINLQITVFAINAYIVDKAWTTAQIQAAASIALSLLTAGTKFMEVYTFFKIMNGEEVASAYVECEKRTPELAKRLSSYLWRVRVGVAIVLLSVIYGMCKVVAVFLCADSMWNVTGCVDMDQ